MKKKATKKQGKGRAKAAATAPSAMPMASLFSRIAAILEEARGNVVRAINSGIRHIGWGVLADLKEAVEETDVPRGVSPSLGWSHHRAFMQGEHPKKSIVG